MKELLQQLLDKIALVLENKKAVVALYVFVALGISVIIGGAATYLVTYDGSGNTAAALSSNDIPLPDSAAATPTITPVIEATTAPIVVAPAGGWDPDSCRLAGTQMGAETSSFWSNPQGDGCNVLMIDGWITLP